MALCSSPDILTSVRDASLYESAIRAIKLTVEALATGNADECMVEPKVEYGGDGLTRVCSQEVDSELVRLAGMRLQSP
jgi:hypothetical protein